MVCTLLDFELTLTDILPACSPGTVVCCSENQPDALNGVLDVNCAAPATQSSN